MKRWFALGGVALLFGFAAGQGEALPPSPSFTITAAGVTMTNAAYTPVPFTLTSVNGYAGSVYVTCTPPTVSAGVKVPFCQTGAVAHIYPLVANGTATGEVDLYAYEDAVPGVTTENRVLPRGGAGWVMAGVLMLGLGIRRRRRFKSGGVLLAVGMLVGLTAMGGCGSNPPTLTPGTYIYTLAAADQSNPPLSASTTVQVTVPAGIVIPKGN
jgi:hypothetical protein